MGLIFFFFNSYPFLHCKFVRHFLNIGWIIKAPPSHPTNFWGGRSPSVPLKSPPLCIIICRSYTINFFYDKAFFSNYFESDAVHLANLSSMEMFDVGPTLGASIANLSRTEVPWVGSTSGATVANVSNDVFEVGAILYYCHKTLYENSHTRQTCRKIAALDYFCRLEHDILFSGRAASEHVQKSLLYIQLVWVLWIGTKLDLNSTQLNSSLIHCWQNAANTSYRQ